MKSFAYLTADSFPAASGALTAAKAGTALPKSGGTDLLELLKERVVEPDELVNLLKASPKGTISAFKDRVEIPALTTLAEVGSSDMLGAFPALRTAAAEAATPQVRNVGTVGGNLAQNPRCPYLRQQGYECFRKGDAGCAAMKPGAPNRFHAIFPTKTCASAHSSNLAPALIALGAEVKLVGKDGARTIPIEKLYGPPTKGRLGDTVLAPGELIERVIVRPSALTQKSTYVELRERQSFDFALVAVAVAVELEDGKVKQARIVCSAVAPTPRRATAAEAALVGKPLNAAAIAKAAELTVQGATPLSQNSHKTIILKRLVERALGALA